MKVGDLVTVLPAKMGLYIILDDDIKQFAGEKLHNCVLLHSLGEGWELPMGKVWIKIINEVGDLK